MNVGDIDFVRLETERLIMRRFRFTDITSFQQYRSEPAVAKYQSWTPEKITIDYCTQFITEMLPVNPNIPEKWFQFAIELKGCEDNDGILVGDCGIVATEEDPSCVKLGITLAGRVQGQGLAAEAVKAVLKYLFTALARNRVRCEIDTRNESSLKLFQKLGFIEVSREGDIPFKGEMCEEVTLELTREQWENRQ